ncbi:MAG: ribonuclease HI [Eubacteriales bacterium]|nr:ribonuclease HI [Eubacteriales bacterium]
MSEGKRTVQIYTDGACSGNPGPGGWAAILSFNGKTKELSGHMPNTTNNRMELFAVISALGALKEPCVVEVYSDSAYTVNAFNQHWIDNWQRNGWLNSEKKPVENSDLWKLLLQIIRIKKHEVTYHKVKGHADHPQNIRCDELARAAIQEFRRMNGEEEEAKASAPVPEKKA